MTQTPWGIRYHPLVAEDFRRHVALKDKDFISETIEKRLSTEQEKIGKALRNDLSGYRRIRISKYRVIYEIKKNTITVYVLIIDRREDVYQEVFRRLGL